MELTNIILLKFVCFMCLAAAYASNYLNPDWVETHAWAKDKDPLKQLCPQISDCKSECLKNSNANTAYRRLVSTVFDRKYYQKDDSTKYFYRTLHIHATEEQLEKLSKLADADDIDGLVAEILAQTKFGTFQIVKEYTVDVLQMIRPTFDFEIPSRAKYLIMNFTLLLIAYAACRRFNISFLLVIFFTAAYFLYEYLDYECHKRIAIEDTVNFLYGSEKNPCETKRNPTWWEYLTGRGSKAECIEYLERVSRSSKKCGIVDLFHEFSSNILFKQLKLFFFSLADLVQSVNKTYGIIITVITLFLMKDLLKTIIYSTFKFFLNPGIWSNVYANVNATAQTNQTHVVGNMVETVRIQSITSGEPDIRDVNLGKALDLANNRVRLALLESTSSQLLLSERTTSSVQLLSINNESSEKINASADATKSDVLEQSSRSDDDTSRLETDISEVEVLKATISTVTENENGACFEKTDIEVVNRSDKSASSDCSDNSDYVVL